MKLSIIILTTLISLNNAICQINTTKKQLELEIKIESLALAFLKQTKALGISIAVNKKGETVYSEGFGYANVKDVIEMDETY